MSGRYHLLAYTKHYGISLSFKSYKMAERIARLRCFVYARIMDMSTTEYKTIAIIEN